MPKEKRKAYSPDSLKVISPSPKLRALYHDYLGLFFSGTFLSWFIPAVLYLLYIGCMELILTLTILSCIVILPVVVSTMYWIAKYTSSLSFELTQNEIIVSKGVWWKKKNIVPYNRITNIDTIQGPLSRHHSIGKAEFQTAGYSGPAGGHRKTEASIWGVEHFEEIKETVLGSINKIHPSVAVESRYLQEPSTVEGLLRNILVELKKMSKQGRS